ncbi:MAG TPA: RNA polymerase sigma factor [Pyrinomonadaceae bacterium]
MSNSDETQELTDSERQRFHELYMKHHRDVYRVCFRMTRDVCEAEDLTQDVFVHLFRTIGSFRGESQFSTWLHRLTVNIVLMHFRKRRRAERTTTGGELPVQVAAGSHRPERMRIVDRILLSEVLAKLPDGYREAVILHDIEGLRHSEIAEMKGRSAGTSKSQLHKGRAMLRKLINQSHPERNVRPQPLPAIA